MKSQELAQILIDNGFLEESMDTGCNYSKTAGPIKLICYIEPVIDVQFVSIYSWKNNDVKGTHNVSMTELNMGKDSVVTMFRKTKNNLPQFIGEKIDTHIELEKAIDEIFRIPVKRVSY